MQKVIKSYSYDEQREQPSHPSFTSELTSHLLILFLKVFRSFADLTSEDNFPHNLGPTNSRKVTFCNVSFVPYINELHALVTILMLLLPVGFVNIFT